MELSSKDQTRLLGIVEQYQLDLIVLFGSHAKGKTHKGSDIDLAVRCHKELTLEKRLELSAQLDKIFPNCEVCDVRSAPPLLLGAIAQDAKLIYEREPSTFTNFRIRAVNEYLDYQPYLKLRAQKNSEAIEKL